MSGFFKGFFKFLAVLVIAAAVVVCVIVLCVSKSQKDSEPSGSSNSAQTETVRTEKPRTSDKTKQSGKDDKDSSSLRKNRLLPTVLTRILKLQWTSMKLSLMST